VLVKDDVDDDFAKKNKVHVFEEGDEVYSFAAHEGDRDKVIMYGESINFD
jgi:hypothetical protein